MSLCEIFNWTLRDGKSVFAAWATQPVLVFVRNVCLQKATPKSSSIIGYRFGLKGSSDCSRQLIHVETVQPSNLYTGKKDLHQGLSSWASWSPTSVLTNIQCREVYRRVVSTLQFQVKENLLFCMRSSFMGQFVSSRSFVFDWQHFLCRRAVDFCWVLLCLFVHEVLFEVTLVFLWETHRLY